VALVIVQVAFASGSVEGKLAMASPDGGGEGVSPLGIAMARMLGAALVFQTARGLVARSRGAAGTSAASPSLTLRDHGHLALLALFGVVLNQTLFLFGLSRTSPVTAALLSVTIPVFTAALAVATRQEAPHARTFFGLGISTTGVVWLTGVRDVDGGAALVAVNSLLYSVYLLLAKPLLARMPALTVQAWIFTWAALAFLPFGGPVLLRGMEEWSVRAWVLVGYVVVVCTVVAYLLNAWALARAPASIVTVYIFLQPVVAALVGWVQLGVAPPSRTVVAGGLIALGVQWVARRHGSHRLALGAR
jgi:drug/metabolite transporter (DMT)-like permease